MQHIGRTEMRKAAFKRRRDAEALLRAGRPHATGAMYLAGYAVECKLKAIAIEAYNCWTLEQLAMRWKVDDQVVYTHGLEALFNRMPLYRKFQSSSVWPDFVRYVNRWRVYWRYDPRDRTVEEAAAFLEAANRVYDWLESNIS